MDLVPIAVPRKLIRALLEIETLAEGKVLLFVVLMTLDGVWVQITNKEFQRGIRMSQPAINAGIKAAIKHGYIDVKVDDSDEWKRKKSYRAGGEFR